VAKIQAITAPSGILHEGSRPCVIVFGNIQARTLEEAGSDIRRISKELAGKGVGAEVEGCGKS
jgi:hypothetical protein